MDLSDTEGEGDKELREKTATAQGAAHDLNANNLSKPERCADPPMPKPLALEHATASSDLVQEPVDGVIPGLIRLSTLATCDAEDVWGEDKEAVLESVSVVGENVFLLKYYRRYFHEILLVEFAVKEGLFNSAESLNSIDSLLNSPFSQPTMPPTRLSLPGNGTIIGPFSQPSSSEFFYKYVSFDEPGVVYWGLVGSSDKGNIEVTSDILFQSPLNEKQGPLSPIFSSDTASYSTSSSAASLPHPSTPQKSQQQQQQHRLTPNPTFKRAEAVWSEDILFEVKLIEVPDPDDSVGEHTNDVMVLFMGRQFVYDDSPSNSPWTKSVRGGVRGGDEDVCTPHVFYCRCTDMSLVVNHSLSNISRTIYRFFLCYRM